MKYLKTYELFGVRTQNRFNWIIKFLRNNDLTEISVNSFVPYYCTYEHEYGHVVEIVVDKMNDPKLDSIMQILRIKFNVYRDETNMTVIKKDVISSRYTGDIDQFNVESIYKFLKGLTKDQIDSIKAEREAEKFNM